MKALLFAAACAAILLATIAFLIPAHAVENWERLGTRTVDLARDVDTITVGRSEGRFTAIMFEVDGEMVEMRNVRVIFGDGQAFSPSTQLILDDQERSRAIDLPGPGRIIRSVTFNYKSPHTAQGHATITLYGR